jgi:hypothetical protein
MTKKTRWSVPVAATKITTQHKKEILNLGKQGLKAAAIKKELNLPYPTPQIKDCLRVQLKLNTTRESYGAKVIATIKKKQANDSKLIDHARIRSRETVQIARERRRETVELARERRKESIDVAKRLSNSEYVDLAQIGTISTTCAICI